jgi:uncharacterized protein (TIGR02466 family)
MVRKRREERPLSEPSSPFAKSEVLPFFPSLVWRFRLPEQEAARMNTLVIEKGEALAGHLKGDYEETFMQTHQKLHLDPTMAPLTERILLAARTVLQMLALDQHPFEVTGLWVNIGRPGATHKRHRHNNNFLSGTYYARTPAGANAISFFDPRTESGLLCPQPARLTQHNAGKVTLTVEPGEMLLWHSWFRHQVPPNTSSEDRYTASFNLMFSRFTELHSPPMIQKVVDSL